MTAHGLAAFVGWAAFALMGISWWILAECGFPIQGWGWRFAVACWWTMTVGVTGVVVTCLGMGFAGSWVFLYPLPFHGTWSHRATAIFALSILSVGLSIFAYCFGILATVTGPGLGARSRGFGNRLGCALGFGYIWPRRFATEQPLPFPVIPLTVIAVDMIIATVPLAVLLVEMVVQSIWPGLTVNPVLAKSMLWWFGHPVVYLLLFPAVAVYYHLIPRYAKRPLVAGHIIGIAWLIGVCTNVVIGAHHMYLDFPNTFQQTVNLGMQPLTYAVTIPSALSLYSLELHDLPLRLPVDAGGEVPGGGDGVVARRRAPGRGPRDDPVRRPRPQHPVGRGPLPQHGAAQHRARRLRRGVRVRPQAHRAGVAQQPARRLAPRPDRRRRLRQRRPVDASGPRGRPPALGEPARPVRDADPGRAARSCF